MNSGGNYVKNVYGEFSGSNRLKELLKKGVRKMEATQCKYKSVGRVINCVDSQCSNCNSIICEPDLEIPKFTPKNPNFLSSKNNKIIILDMIKINGAERCIQDASHRSLDISDLIKQDVDPLCSQLGCSLDDMESALRGKDGLSLVDVSPHSISVCGSDHMMNTAFSESQTDIQCGQKMVVSVEIHPQPPASQPAIPSGEDVASEIEFVNMNTEEFMKPLTSANTIVEIAESRKRSSTENLGGDAPLKKSRDFHMSEINKLQSRKSECWFMIQELQKRILEFDKDIAEHQEAIFRD